MANTKTEIGTCLAQLMVKRLTDKPMEKEMRSKNELRVVKSQNQVGRCRPVLWFSLSVMRVTEVLSEE